MVHQYLARTRSGRRNLHEFSRTSNWWWSHHASKKIRENRIVANTSALVPSGLQDEGLHDDRPYLGLLIQQLRFAKMFGVGENLKTPGVRPPQTKMRQRNPETNLRIAELGNGLELLWLLMGGAKES